MIQHGIPKHPFFLIVQPDIGTPYGERVKLDPQFKKPVIELQDPVKKSVSHAELWDVFKFHIDEVPRHMFMLTYGADAQTVIPNLEQKFPSIKQTRKVEFLLLKKL